MQLVARRDDPVADGYGIDLSEDALDAHEAQVEIATQAEMVSAISEVTNRVDAGLVYEVAA